MPSQDKMNEQTIQERVANANILVIVMNDPVPDNLIPELLENVGPLYERVKEAYVAYDDGFGHIVRV